MTGYGILIVIAAVVVSGLYVCSLVAIIKSRARDRAVECAGTMVLVLLILMAALSVPDIPSWISPSLGFLVLLLGLWTLFFLLKRAADVLSRKRVLPLNRHSSPFQLSVQQTLEHQSAEEEYVLNSQSKTSGHKKLKSTGL
jgi:hypothetical protein